MPTPHAPKAMPVPLAAISTEINRSLASWLDQADVCSELREAIDYSLLGGGKRLRPALAWLACEAVGAPGNASLPAGAAVEMIHAFSLIHDDLPAMDDDDLRRGKPTLHLHAGEAMAILAGDALLSMAYEVIARDDLPAPLAVALCRELAAGTRGMIDGQVLDTLGAAMLKHLDPANAVEQIHRRKTGALIAASVRMGTLCGLAHQHMPQSSPELAALDEYANAIGLMFQAVDDLLDVEATPQSMGKRTGKDSQAGKRTYPACLGVEGTRQLVDALIARATRALDPLGSRADPLAELARWLGTRQN